MFVFRPAARNQKDEQTAEGDLCVESGFKNLALSQYHFLQKTLLPTLRFAGFNRRAMTVKLFGDFYEKGQTSRKPSGKS